VLSIEQHVGVRNHERSFVIRVCELSRWHVDFVSVSWHLGELTMNCKVDVGQDNLDFKYRPEV